MHVLLNAVLRRRCCWAPAPAAVDRYLLPAGRSAANPPHAGAAVDRRTDGRTTLPPLGPRSARSKFISAGDQCYFSVRHLSQQEARLSPKDDAHTCRVDIASRAKIRRQKDAYHATPETLLQL